MTLLAAIQQEMGPEILSLIEDLGQDFELRRVDGEGEWTDDGQQGTGGGTLWAGKGILVPLTHQQAIDAGSTTGTPVLQVFLPPDAPAGQPGFMLYDPTADLTYYPRRDAIDWKGLVWDLLVGAPGERSQ